MLLILGGIGSNLNLVPKPVIFGSDLACSIEGLVWGWCWSNFSSQSLLWFFRCIQHTHSFGRSLGLMLIYSLLYFAGFSPHFLDSVATFHNYFAQRVEILFCVVQSFFVWQCCRIALGCSAERKVKYKK